jgi:ABC-type sugar transport system ATPase subunit
MSGAPRFKVEGLNKSFYGVQVLNDVSFEAFAGEVLGIVGENGSGKSTTMNILAGVLQRDGGAISLDGVSYSPKTRRESGALGVAFIQQELSSFPNLSVAENLFLGRFPRQFKSLPIVSYRTMNARARELLKSVDLDVDPSTATNHLSAGERQLLEIARGLATEARLMIFDEPTTSLTQRETSRLFAIIERLRSRGVAIIYVSHALDDVLRLSNRIVVLRDGRVTQRALSEETSAQQLVVSMVGRSIEALFPNRAERSYDSAPLLHVSDVGEPGVVHNISFCIGRGEIVGLAGLMGSGRSELARILFGLDPHRRGKVSLKGRVLQSNDLDARLAGGMAYLTEDRRHEGLMMDASISDNMALAALPLFTARGLRRVRDQSLRAATSAFASRLNIKSGDIHSTAVRTLSGGNQQKVALGRWLLRKPSFFILDEPTRGVDVGAKEEIYRLLAQMVDEGMGILVISSEIEELIGLCDRILVLHRGQLQSQFQRAEFDREAILRAAFGQERAA